ncbi:MAG: phosphoribosylformylglycinamidine synthase subunit PurQ [Chloroflexi bacterium]|nr:phosphoribosylformylglycinamidine synthase subunit PurQ [Chloroflexota bacterium]
MRFGIVVFPGTWSDGDCYHSLKDVLGQEAEYLWHKDQDLSSLDCIVLPGGFSYGDYLRAGAIARFSPVMSAVERFAVAGGLVIGICNGFQVLCESGLLPGVLMRNVHLQFRCQWAHVRVERSGIPFTSSCKVGQVLRIPISHGEGNYYADDATIDDLESNGRVVLRYCTPQGEATSQSNPNGSLRNIAGIVNREGNVLGMMPHPERCCEEIMGGTDGRYVFESIIGSLVSR